MRLIARKDHAGEGTFPTFLKDSNVENIKPCIAYEFWRSCSIKGYDTYIPIDYIKDEKLAIDYNPTELVLKKGDSIELLEVTYDWAYAKKGKICGWVPFGILTSE